MKTRVLLQAALAVLCLIIPSKPQAQVASYTITRQKWVTQLSTNPVPLAYRFSTTVTGVGTLKSGEIRSPKSTNALSGNTLQLNYATNFAAVAVDGTNVLSGADGMNAAFPPGSYQLIVQSKIGITTLTTNINASLTGDFPAATPVITNIPPLTGLAETQVFSWPLFSSSSLAYARFYLLEGAIDTNLVNAVLSGGIEALTNTLGIVAMELKIPAAQNSITVSGIDPNLDHMAMLEFHDPATLGGLGGISEAGTVCVGLSFYYSLHIVSEPQSMTVEAGEPATFAVVAIGSKPITYQWRHNGTNVDQATNALLVIPAASNSLAGAYSVVVSNPGGSRESAVATLTVTDPGEQDQPILVQPAISSQAGFSFGIVGTPGATYEVQASSDLVHWDIIGQSSSPSGTNTFNDASAATRPSRFYKARWLQ